ncbi:PAS domain-containing protein [Sphingomonas mesophila]|uniref:PAS domain-containing protein n=1 Tax=Sphingomonas mesophila TaxID=2303576 RepID=UPI001F080980|nr:PAS domain-containing protein [Sphingomonas mesophila]
MSEADPGAAPFFLRAEGEAAAVMRARDWSTSPLGQPEEWPQELRSVVALMLPSKFPMFAAWGDELGFLYNDAYSQILGEKHPDAMGARFREIWSEIWDDISPLIDRAMSGEASYFENLPLTMNRRGFDEETWFTFSYSPLYDSSGTVRGMFCACTETTDQMLAERAASTSEQRYRTLFESIDEGFGVLQFLPTADGEAEDYYHLEANAAFIAHTGIDDALGQKVRSRLPDEAPRWIERFSAVRKTGIPVRFEERLEETGRLIDVYAFRVEPKELDQVALLFRDITAKRRDDERLRELAATLERRFEEALAERKILADIVENTDAFVQVVDLDFRFLAINRASANEFERVFGVLPKVGDSMLDLLADQPEHQADVGAIWSRALAGEEFTEVAEFGDPNRARRHYEIKFNALRDAEGRLIGAYQFVHDVTQRVEGERRLLETQDALRQSQKLETLGQITGGVAHDFNNLLTPIVGSLDLIRRRHDDDPRMARLLDGALQAAERASTLVQRLLAFSRRQVLRPRATPVAELVENMSELIRRSIGPRIAVELDFAPDLKLAQVDPNQLELALLNLAVNARDAMDGVGTLRISARNETIGHRPPLNAGDYVRLEVSDTGRGMDAETLRRATEPFFTTKDVGHGTGLGLSSVSGLVAQSGGDFALASEIGEGTTATLWLPEAVDTGEVSTAKRSSAPQEARTAAVLLVDDEPLVRDGAAEMLADGGFAVASAASGGEALKMLADGVAAEILVTDYAMPGMTGIELAQQARALRPGLKVLLISGYPAEAEADDQLKTIPRLDKPFRQDELLRALAELG